MCQEVEKKEKIELLDWLDSYEAWNLALSTAKEHHVNSNDHHIIYYFLPIEKSWKAVKSKLYGGKNIKNANGEDINGVCYMIELGSTHAKLKVSENQFENIVTALIEGTKNFVKRYYS